MNYIKIILCSNISGAGKDSVRQYLEQKYNFWGIAFADKIRTIAKVLFDMKQKDRNLLQRVGEKLREIDSYVWINYTFKRADRSINFGRSVVVSDMRKVEEYEVAINKGYIPIRIVCDREIAIQRLIERDGYCDISLLDAPVEIGTRNIQMLGIDNNGTLEELYQQIDELMKWMEIKGLE